MCFKYKQYYLFEAKRNKENIYFNSLSKLDKNVFINWNNNNNRVYFVKNIYII